MGIEIAKVGQGFHNAAEEVEYIDKLTERLTKSRREIGFKIDQISASEIVESIANARNIIQPRLEEMFSAQVEKAEKRKASKLFQPQGERKGLAKGKAGRETDDLAKGDFFVIDCAPMGAVQ